MSDGISDALFHQDGLQFECVHCGACCKVQAAYAYLYVTSQHLDAIARYLQTDSIVLLSTCCGIDEQGNMHLTMENGHCRFLKNDRCSIYPVRPTQCRSFPFLTENLNAASWNQVKSFCRGIGRGRQYSEKEIVVMAKQRDDDYRPDGS